MEQLQQAVAAQRGYIPFDPAAALAETLPAEPAVPLDSDLPFVPNDEYGPDDLSRFEDVAAENCRAAEVLDGPVESAEQVRGEEATNHLEPPREGTSEACVAVEPERDRDSESESNPDSPGEPSCDSLPFSSVMAQLQQMGVWREDALEPDDSGERVCDIDSEGQPVNPALTSLAGIPVDDDSPAANEPSRRSGDEDESIESYMNRLLVRLRGPSGTTGYVCTAPPEREQEERAPITEPNWCPVPDPTPTEPEEATDFRPRSLAPEGSVNLAAMRALANDSARTAIAVHKRQSLYYQVLLNMLGALVAMAVCACFIHQFRHDSLLTNVCVIVALAAGAFGLTKYVLYRRAGQNAADDSPLPGPHGFLPLPSPAIVGLVAGAFGLAKDFLTRRAGQNAADDSPLPGPHGFLPLPSQAIVAEEPQVPADDTAGETEDAGEVEDLQG